MNLQSLSIEELGALVAPANAPRAALFKLFAAIHAHGVRSLAGLRAAPQVPRRVVDALAGEGVFEALTVVERRRAEDGFVKYLFESPLGGRVEAVRIPLFEEKYVVCVSSQVGCALACGSGVR